MNVVPVITGIGLVTPLGRSANQTWQALLAGESIRDHARLDYAQATDIPRITVLATQAAREAIAQAAWARHPMPDGQTAIVVGTSKGPIERWIGPPPSTSDKTKLVIGRCGFGLAELASQLSDAVNITGPRLTLSAACASGLHALIRGAMMICGGEASRVLVVAAEASVHPLFLASFRRLGVLSPLGALCRPFDVNRQGFLMSEAAAAVCLEASSPESKYQIPPIAVVERFALGGDGTHLISGDPQSMVLRHLLKQVLAGWPVDLIHAHGTGTIVNDVVELGAIELTLQQITHSDDAPEPITIYSHKGALGHSLGAAGLISIVLNCLSHVTGQVPPNINTPNPLPATGVSISQKTTSRPIRRSLAIATGFGGPIAVASLIRQ